MDANTLNIIATVNGLVGSIMPGFQILRVFRNGSGRDVSLITWIISLVTSAIWCFYGTQINSLPIMASAIVMIILDIALIGYVCWLRLRGSNET